jgi:chemotaxis protein histidine kinase CheA
VRAALGLSQVDEALYLQRQQEIQRDFQLRQMLLAEQMDQQSRLDSMLQEHQLKAIGEHLHEFPDLQQHYSRLLLNEQFQRQEGRSLYRERQIQQEELRRMALAQGSNTAHSAPASQTSETTETAQQTKSQSSAKIQAGSLKDIAADSLAGNAVKKNETEKRFFAKPDDDCVVVDSKKRSRSNTAESAELDRKQKSRKGKKPAPKDESSENPLEETKDKDESAKSYEPAEPAENAEKSETAEDGAENSFEDNAAKPSAQALLDFAATTAEAPPVPTAFAPRVMMSPPPHMTFTLGTLGDLLSAGSNIKTTDDAASTLVGIKKTADWPDSESDHEDDLECEKRVAKEKGDIIQLPGFTSILPQLPKEPEVRFTQEKPKKHKGLLDDDSVDAKPRGKSKPSKTDSRGIDNGGVTNPDSGIFEYPYPIDTWWPSTTNVRRERKLAGESVSGDRFDESDKGLGKDSPFRANVEKIQQKLSTEVTPGILEKVPHCRIHRMLMKKRKNPSAPELVYCFQVTELYPNDVMVCCSHCGTWRHTACGGHHKPYSVRESIEAPFVPVCDRCHEEEKIVRDHPLARMRIDRQRTEQIRRGLSTSAAMRQASFSKHGGTYKWPLGSVSATHIGGHTRSVHSRHDKAEKQWMDMATRLGRGYGYRPKERVKFRTKELERLLVSIEDAGKEVYTELDTFSGTMLTHVLFLQRVIWTDII